MNLGLSKTKYCKGVQCPKMLWLEKYKPEEAEDILPESILATGNMVGDIDLPPFYVPRRNLV